MIGLWLCGVILKATLIFGVIRELILHDRSLSLFDFNEPIAAKLGSERLLIAADPTQSICPLD